MKTLPIFSIWSSPKYPTNYRRIRWTETQYTEATLRPYTDYIEEVEKEGNECASKLATLLTAKGNKYIWWYDYETEEYFVSKVDTTKDD